MYNIVDRKGNVLASVGAYVQAQRVVTYYARKGIATHLVGAVQSNWTGR